MEPPQLMQLDEPEAADQARRRLLPRRTFPTFFGRKSAKVSQPQGQLDAPPSPSVTEPTDDLRLTTPMTVEFVDIDDSVAMEEDNTTDVYRWAIIYENQRGLTLFSTAYYSPLGLLPFDPPAFTLPDVNRRSLSKSREPSFTLASYPLPDGNWRWVSKTWMVDMRGDVQYDGFEYNWFFRKDKWRGEVGSLSTGAWVRRRRWVRLMVNPATCLSSKTSTTGTHVPMRHSPCPSRPDSNSNTFHRPLLIWEGDPHEDWFGCRDYLKSFPRDGKKLEIWQQWLGIQDNESDKVIKKQWTEDDTPLVSQTFGEDSSTQSLVSPVQMEFIVPVIRENMDEILKTFVFPDSRAKFFMLLRDAGILTDVNAAGLVMSLDSTQSLNFWSYTNEYEMQTRGKGKGKAK